MNAPEPENRCVFHGTSAAFDAFDLDAGRSAGDANARLGVHLADDAREAADYARSVAGRNGGEPTVLVVRAATVNPLPDMSFYEFFGVDPDGGHDLGPERFDALRALLLSEGHDAVDYEDGEQRVFCVLDPSLLEIVARLTPDEADELGAAVADLPDPEDDAERFRQVDAIVARRGLVAFRAGQ